MDGNEGNLRFKPCEKHEQGKRRCLGVCPDGTWVPVESKRTACDACVKRKKTCTHKEPGVQAPIKPEPDPDLSTFQKPASGKSKRAQEVPVSSTASKKPASGGKKQRVQEEKPTSNKVSKKPASGGKSAVDEEPFAFEEELDLNFWDDALAEQYNEEERALEEQYFRDGLRDLLASDDLR